MRSKQYFTSIKNNPHEISTDPNLSVFCRLVQKKSPDAGIMGGQCPEIFLDIRTKSRSFCTNIRVNFLMFTSTFQLFFP